MDADKLKKGKEHIKAPTGGGKFTPVIYWKENQESKHIAIITPVDEMYTLDVHTVETKNGWRSVVCRRNDAFMDDSNGECPVCALGDSPGRKHFALAAELEAVEQKVGGRRKVTDLKVKMIEREKDGETKHYPRIGVLTQSASNFFNYLTAYDAQRDDITTLSFEVVRDGKGAQTAYQFFPVDLRPDLSEFEEDMPDLVAYIADQGSLDRYEKELEGVKIREREGKKPASKPAAKPAPSPDEDTSFAALRARLENSSDGDE